MGEREALISPTPYLFIGFACNPILNLSVFLCQFQSLFWPGPNVNSITHKSHIEEACVALQSNSVLRYQLDGTCSLDQWKHANEVNE